MSSSVTGLHIVHTESSCGWGGQEIRILTEAQGMMARGHRVTIICALGAPLLFEARARDIPVVALNIEKKRLSGIVALRAWLRHHQPDVINTHSSTDSWLVAAAQLGVGRCCPVVRTRHVSVPVAANPFNRWLYGRSCERVVTTGEALRIELVERLPLPAPHVISVPTGIDLTQFSRVQARSRAAARAALGVPEDAIVLGIVATLRSWKGHEFLLEAFEQLAGVRPELHLVIAGDGPRRHEIADKVQTITGGARVHMLGQRTDVPDVLAAMDVFVLPSYANEGVPQALIQAMAMELPVVTTQVGAIPELVADGATGYVVAPRDAAALAKRIESLIQQPNVRADMGRRGRAVVEQRYSLAAMIDSMERVFYSALHRPYPPVASIATSAPRKRILHVFTTLPVGGAENVLLSTLRRLNSKQYESTVCCLRDKGALGQAVEALGVPLIELNRLHVGGWDGRIVRDLAAVIKDQRIDIVHAHLYHASLYSRLAARRVGVPVVVTTHNTYPKQHHKWHRRVLNWWLARGTATLIAVSEDIKRDIMRDDHVDGGRIRVIPNGINIDRVQSMLDKPRAKARLGVPADAFVFGNVGRLEEQKGHRLLIEAFSRVVRRHPNAVLILTGDGRERAALEAHAVAACPPGSVFFLGMRADVGDVLRAFDLFVMPSLWEGLALAMLEAMAAGVPVLVSDVGGVSEVLGEDKYGMRIPAGNVDALAAKLAECIANPDSLAEMAARAAARVREQYSESAMVAQIESVYEQLGANRNGSAPVSVGMT